MKQRILTAALAVVLCASTAGAQQAKRPGYLGIRFEETLELGDVASQRVIVREVSKDSPAEKAGLKAGDEITRINGLSASNGKFSALARTLTTGDTVQLSALRDGKERDFTIVAAPRPTAMAYYRYGDGTRIEIAPDSVRRLMLRFLDSARVHLDSLHLPSITITGDSGNFNVRVAPFMWRDSLKGDSNIVRMFRTRPGELPRVFTPDMEGAHANMVFRTMDLGARSIGGAELSILDPAMVDYFKTDHGLLVLRVAPETPADRAGLHPGDVVLQAKDRAVNRIDDLRSIVAANPEGVKLEVLRKGARKTLELKTRR